MVETIIGNRALKAKEDRLLPTLSPYEQHGYVKLREEAIIIEQRNPNLDVTANTRFVSQYLDAAVEHRRGLDEYRLKAKQNGIVPDPGSIAELSRQMRQNFVDNYKQNTLPSLERGESPQTRGHSMQAHTMLMDAMSDETIPEKAAGQFYKKEKGGFRWAGIIGGLVGGLFIFNQMGGFAGGAVGLIATALATLAGAWLVNTGVEKASNFISDRRARNQGDFSRPLAPDVPGQQPDLNLNQGNWVNNDRKNTLMPELTGEIIPNRMVLAATEVSETDSFSPGSTPSRQTPVANGPQPPAAPKRG